MRPELRSGWSPEWAPSPEAAPVAPVGPELPETATGAATAVEDAAPVAAVFVAEDWPVAGPVAPERAKGASSSFSSWFLHCSKWRRG